MEPQWARHDVWLNNNVEMNGGYIFLEFSPGTLISSHMGLREKLRLCHPQKRDTTHNLDIISEGLKGHVKCTFWLAGVQKDRHDWPHCFWRILYDPGLIRRGLGSDFRYYFNDHGQKKKKKKKHLYSRGISHGRDLRVSELKVPTLVYFDVQTRQLQYVIFVKKPMEHPGIFHCTSWVNEYIYFLMSPGRIPSRRISSVFYQTTFLQPWIMAHEVWILPCELTSALVCLIK